MYNSHFTHLYIKNIPMPLVNQEFRNTMIHRTLLKPSEKMSNSPSAQTIHFF